MEIYTFPIQYQHFLNIVPLLRVEINLFIGKLSEEGVLYIQRLSDWLKFVPLVMNQISVSSAVLLFQKVLYLLEMVTLIF